MPLDPFMAATRSWKPSGGEDVALENDVGFEVVVNAVPFVRTCQYAIYSAFEPKAERARVRLYLSL